MTNSKICLTETSRGSLYAKVSNDPNYPGLQIYLDKDLYALIEVYEEDGLLRAHLFNEKEDEPIISETLADFNK